MISKQITICIVLSIACVLFSMYRRGYWDTWDDKRNAYIQFFEQEMVNEDMSQTEKLQLATCLTTQLLSVAKELKCDVHSSLSVEDDVKQCFKAHNYDHSTVMMIGITCAARVFSDSNE